MRRVKLRFSRGLVVEFMDRGRAIEQVREVAERGTYPVYVIYGPEGCGKTALLKQAKEVLEEHGYSVIYANPLAEDRDEALIYTPTLRDAVKEALKLFPDLYSRIVDVAINVAGMVMRRLRRPRVAVLMDDIFQAVGLDNAEKYVKMLLNLIEYPPGEYEKIVVLVASSEGVTRERVGRHNWAAFRLLWNMNREGFRELYNAITGPKPEFEDIWSLTGGNPRYLGRLYGANWNPDLILNEVIKGKKLRRLVALLNSREAEILRDVVNNPDMLFERLKEPEAQSLERKLIELNLIIEVWDRDMQSWIDEPPPERDPELGIGRYYAWQTPIHREAIKKAIETVV